MKCFVLCACLLGLLVTIGHGELLQLQGRGGGISCSNWPVDRKDPVQTDEFWIERKAKLESLTEAQGGDVLNALEDLLARFKESVIGANCREMAQKESTSRQMADVRLKLKSHPNATWIKVQDKLLRERKLDHKLYRTHLEMDHAAVQPLEVAARMVRSALGSPQAPARARAINAAKAMALELCSEALEATRLAREEVRQRQTNTSRPLSETNRTSASNSTLLAFAKKLKL